MTRQLVAVAVLISSFFILNSPFAHAAGVVQLPATGQTASYVAGDDGALQRGETWQTPRFADNGDQSMTDTLTNLIWSKDGNAPGPAACGPAATKTWPGALDYVDCLNSNSYLGKTDWRLPNRKELISLVNRGQTNSDLWLNSQGFSGVQGNYYWSSSTVAGSTGYVWVVGINYGYVYDIGNAVNYYVWPVRGGQWSLDTLVLYGSFSLGSTNVGQSAPPRVVTLHNTGIASQAVSTISITGVNTNQFSVVPGGTTPCASLTPTLTAGEKCTLNLEFAPTSSGAKSASLTISSNADTLNIPVYGSAYTTITGTVVDQITKAPISGATVTLTGGATATTDAGGAFSFGTSLANDTYTATVSKTGYANTAINYIVVYDTQGAVLDVGMIAPGGINIASPSTLLHGETGKAFDLRLPVSGGTAPFTLSKAYGNLPPGITLDKNGIAGIPTTAGSYVFALAVSDSVGGYAEQEYTLTVTAPLTISTGSILTRGVKGTAYSKSILASGGVAPYSFSLLYGALPVGVTLNSSNGAISGTIDANAAGAAFTIKVTDSVGRTTSKNFSLPVDSPLTITTTRLNDAITGSAHTQTLAASGGYAPYVWSIFSGTLPPGLSLDSSTGVISGTATSATSQQIVISLSDNAGRVLYKQFTLNALNPLQITTTAMPNAHVGDFYSELIRTSGGIAPFTYSYTGLLPAGLTLNSTTGIISGTPTSASYVNLTLTVSDSSYPAHQSITQTLGVRTSSQMTITTGTILPTARVNLAISPLPLTVAGGTSPFTWSIVGGTPPPGLNLNATTGIISGTPTTAGDYTFTVRLADSVGNVTGTLTNPDKQFFMHVSAPLAITTATVPAGGVGIPYAATLAASGGQQYYTWGIVTGTLPAGLNLDTVTGVISGTPTVKITSSNVTFSVTDSDNPAQSTQKVITFNVKDTLTINENTLPIGRVNQAYTSSVHAWLGTTPYTWRVSTGALPPGLALTQNAGVATISGTPTTAGSYTFTLEVTDSSPTPQVIIQSYTVIVYHPLVITTVSLPGAQRTVPYSASIVAAGGVTPYTYSVAGTLPLGLALNAVTGEISGTPTAVTSQSSAFSVMVTDSGVPSGSFEAKLDIIVTDPIPVNGICGSSHGAVLPAAPTTNLCISGTPSASGVWSWSCAGQYGGTTSSCSATFGYQVSVTLAGTGGGTVTSDAVAIGVPYDISCFDGKGSICSSGYPNGSVVTLTAIPNTTSTFTSWGGDCSATPCIVTMNTNRAVTATFTNADRARIVGGLGYSTLGAAYAAAANGATIRTLDTTLAENLTMNKSVNIILDGGWNAPFTGLSGLFTELYGMLTIESGSLTVDRLTIK